MSQKKIQNYINHIVFVVDKSGSMSHLSDEVVKVFDSQIAHLATRSKELDQETRVSVYLFANGVDCLIYDMDVMRLPSLRDHYNAGGGTALIDGTITAVDDLSETPQKYGDHAFLVYVLTDGEENQSRSSASTLAKKIDGLKDNWTLAVLVPNQNGVFEAKKFGFPVNNIQVWSTTKDGVEEVGRTIRVATDNFMTSRSAGIRGTKNLFNLDSSKLTTTKVGKMLQELAAREYELLPVHKDAVIKDYVESWTKREYIKGSTYYQLVKPETIQPYKQICVQDKRNGKVYSGTNARQILSLPDFEVKVSPATHGNFDIFVQSTSVNRKLPRGTKIIVLK
jgi:hypothetical protein